VSATSAEHVPIMVRHNCPVAGCKKTFGQRSDATRHALSVHHRRKYQCKLCPKSFSSKEMVKAHHLNVHLHRRWKCSECLKVFRWQCNLYKHRCRGNPLPQPFACKHCHKSYAHTSGLSRHQKDTGHQRNPKAPKCDVEKERKYQPEPGVTEEVVVQLFRRRHRSRRKWVVGEGVSSGLNPTLLATVHAAGGLVTSDDDSLTPTLMLAAQRPTIVCDGSSSEYGQPWEGKKTMPLPTLLAKHFTA
jgi:hypothetical protein